MLEIPKWTSQLLSLLWLLGCVVAGTMVRLLIPTPVVTAIASLALLLLPIRSVLVSSVK